MFDPKDFHVWLKKRYPQYNPLSVNDTDFIEAVSLGNLEHMAVYDYDSNKKFFMGQIVEYIQDQHGKAILAGIAFGFALALILFGSLLLTVSR